MLLQIRYNLKKYIIDYRYKLITKFLHLLLIDLVQEQRLQKLLFEYPQQAMCHPIVNLSMVNPIYISIHLI